MGPVTSEMSKKGASSFNEIREGEWDKNFIFGYFAVHVWPIYLIGELFNYS
jgi:hypothetical protein